MNDAVIKEVQANLHLTFPAYYKSFLQEQQLDTTRYFNELTCLYGLHDLEEMNSAYQIQQWMADYLMIGSDSGDYAILIKCSSTPDNFVYLTALGALSTDDSYILAYSFNEWVQRGYSSEMESIVETSPYNKRRLLAWEDYIRSPDYQWHETNKQLLQQLNSLENQRTTRVIDLSTYLHSKKKLKAAIDEHLQLNKQYLSFNDWWHDNSRQSST
ncbi:SMI1/KNR4 family protein [Chitinophaga sp. Hz27]|uniref:SMI1/KNR4 family protein n=1 Tax=Chitinophaga sp. Hz27 TaxID=3347169 RepID=UPI0035E0E7D0